MAWCRQATSHYLSQCWPRSLSPYGFTRPQWVKFMFILFGPKCVKFLNAMIVLLQTLYQLAVNLWYSAKTGLFSDISRVKSSEFVKFDVLQSNGKTIWDSLQIKKISRLLVKTRNYIKYLCYLFQNRCNLNHDIWYFSQVSLTQNSETGNHEFSEHIIVSSCTVIALLEAAS